MSELTDKVRSRGHWLVAIHPAEFIGQRVPYDQLSEIIRSLEVRLRGWPLPYAHPGRHEERRGVDWFGMEVDAHTVDHYEAWRFYSSGLFTQVRSISADWRSSKEFAQFEAGDERFIEVWEILYTLTEVFELAARLAFSQAGDETMVISATLHDIQGRHLIAGHPRRTPFFEAHRSDVAAFGRRVELTRERLAADGRKDAATMAREFFLRFGWNPSVELLVDQQRELTER